MRTAVGQPALSAGAGRLGSALKLKAQAKSAGRFTSFVGFRFGAPWAEILGLELRVETVVGWETVICRQAKLCCAKYYLVNSLVPIWTTVAVSALSRVT